MQGSPGPFVTRDKSTLTTTHSRAKVKTVILPGRPCHTSLIIVPDIHPYLLLTVADGFPQRNTQRIMLARLDSTFSPVPNGVLALFSLNTALTLRLSSSKMFANVNNLRRHRRKVHSGLYHFSVSFQLTDITHQPRLTTRTGPSPRCAALVRGDGRLNSYQRSQVYTTCCSISVAPLLLFLIFSLCPLVLRMLRCRIFYFHTVPHALLMLDFNSCCTLPHTFVFNAGCSEGTSSLGSF